MSATQPTARSHWPISILSSIASLFNALLPLVLVRLLTPAEIGVFKIFFLYLTLTPGLALTIGLTNGLAYWSGRGDEGRRAVQATATALMVAALLFFLLTLILRHPIALAFGWTDVYGLLFAFAVLGAIASQFFEEAAICSGRIWIGALFFAGFEIARTLAIILSALLSRDLTIVLLTHTTFSLLKAATGYLAGWKMKLAAFILDKETYRALLRYALPVSLAGLTAIPLTYADQLILSAYIPPAQFALYALGCLAVPPLFILEHAITRVLIPQLSEAFHQGEKNRAALLHRRAIAELSLVLLPAAAGLMIFSTPIIEILFTKEYSGASRYLFFFSFNYAMLIFPYDSVPRALGQGGWILKNFLFFSFMALSLCAVLARFFGPFGALAGVLFSKAAMRTYGMFYVKRCTGWKWHDYIPVYTIQRYATISALLALSCIWIAPFFSDLRYWFLLCAPIFLILYFVALLVWKTRPAFLPDSPTRLLMLSQYLRVGGLEWMIFNLSKELQKSGRWDVRLFSYDGLHIPGHAGLMPHFQQHGFEVEAYQKGRGFSLRIVYLLIRKIMREQIAVVHAHDLGGLIYGVAAKVFCPIRFRLIHTQHSFVHLQEKKRYALYQRIFCRWADQLVTVSPTCLEAYLRLGVPAARLAVVANGVPLPPAIHIRSEKPTLRRALLNRVAADHPLAAHLQAGINDYWIVYPARIHPVKGALRAVALWCSLPAELRKRCRLIFLGPGELEDEVARLQSEISLVPEPDRVFYWGQTQTPQDWYKAADIYLSCSAWEGLPLAPLEAIGHGLPAVLSAIPGHAFLKDQSWQFPLEDAEQGAKCLSEVVRLLEQNSESMQPLLAERAAWVRKHFSTQEMAACYERLYQGDPTAYDL